MTWNYPVEFREIPAGGHFLSDWYIDAAGRRQARALRHSGVDQAPGHPGAPVVVIGPGTVCRVGENPNSGWGYHFYVDHGQVDAEGRHAYSFGAHMQARAAFNVGDLVDGGRLAGHVGKTGTQAAGNHLHWGVAVCFPHEFDTLVAMGSAARNLLVDPIAFVEARLDPLAPDERLVPPPGANVRERPTKDSAEVGEIAPGRQFRADWFERGELRDGVDVWFHTPADGARPAGYVWGGATTDPATHDVPDRTPAPAPVEPAGETAEPEVPAVVEPPAAPPPAPPKPSGRRRATALTKVELPPTPDNVLPGKARTFVYLANWVVGLALSGTSAGVIAAYTVDRTVEPPLWLFIATAVYATVSPSISALAQANRTKAARA